MPDLKASCAAKQLLHDVVSDAHKGLSMAIEDCPTCRWSRGLGEGQAKLADVWLLQSCLQQRRRRSQLAGHLHEDV